MTVYCQFCGYRDSYVYFHDRMIHCSRCLATSAVDRTTLVSYDRAYVADRYDSYPTTDAMSFLRLSILEKVIALDGFSVRGRLLDVGFGNGSFIRAATKAGWQAFGYDVNETAYAGVVRVPLPLTQGPKYDVITFYDSLEHFEEVEPLRYIVNWTDWIVISAPKPPSTFPWDLDWKHCRPGEHHHYPTPAALEKLFQEEKRTSEIAWTGYPEDQIRGKLAIGRDNIFTTVLRVRDR